MAKACGGNMRKASAGTCCEKETAESNVKRTSAASRCHISMNLTFCLRLSEELPINASKSPGSAVHR